jgi:hypothetical protein
MAPKHQGTSALSSKISLLTAARNAAAAHHMAQRRATEKPHQQPSPKHTRVSSGRDASRILLRCYGIHLLPDLALASMFEDPRRSTSEATGTRERDSNTGDCTLGAVAPHGSTLPGRSEAREEKSARCRDPIRILVKSSRDTPMRAKRSA